MIATSLFKPLPFLQQIQLIQDLKEVNPVTKNGMSRIQEVLSNVMNKRMHYDFSEKKIKSLAIKFARQMLLKEFDLFKLSVLIHASNEGGNDQELAQVWSSLHPDGETVFDFEINDLLLLSKMSSCREILKNRENFRKPQFFSLRSAWRKLEQRGLVFAMRTGSFTQRDLFYIVRCPYKKDLEKVACKIHRNLEEVKEKWSQLKKEGQLLAPFLHSRAFTDAQMRKLRKCSRIGLAKELGRRFGAKEKTVESVWYKLRDKGLLLVPETKAYKEWDPKDLEVLYQCRVKAKALEKRELSRKYTIEEIKYAWDKARKKGFIQEPIVRQIYKTWSSEEVELMKTCMTEEEAYEKFPDIPRLYVSSKFNHLVETGEIVIFHGNNLKAPKWELPDLRLLRSARTREEAADLQPHFSVARSVKAIIRYWDKQITEKKIQGVAKGSYERWKTPQLKLLASCETEKDFENAFEQGLFGRHKKMTVHSKWKLLRSALEAKLERQKNEAGPAYEEP